MTRTTSLTLQRTLLIAAAGMLAAMVHIPTVVAQPVEKPPKDLRIARGVVLVMPRAGLSQRELDKALEPHGGRRVHHFTELNVHVVKLPDGANALAVAEALSRNKNIKFAQPDFLRSPNMLPNDPAVGSGWHLSQINTPTAWDTSRGDGITVAVCDSGLDPAHPDIVSVPGYNFFDGNTDTRDVYGHGTKVAGAAAMAGNNGVGGAGVAFRTRIMPVRVTDTQGWGYDSAIASCITFAADNGARGANVSFEGVCGSPVIQTAAKYMRDRGGVVTAAAGNSGTQDLSAASDLMTCVGATDAADARTSWSTYGDFVDVVAPGVSIYTTTSGGGYGSVSGTSFAAPVTLGTYALMMAANSSLMPATLDSVLFGTARDLGTAGKDIYYGYGRIDAAAAVAKATSTVTTDTQPPTVSISSPSGGQVFGVAAVDVIANDAGGIAKVELYVNSKLLATDTVGPYAFSWDTTGLPDGPATLIAKAVDGAGNTTSSAQVGVTVANDRTPPVVQILSPTAGSTVTGSVSISASATDNNKVTKMTLTIDGKEVAVTYGSSLSYSWSTTSKGKGGGKNRTATPQYSSLTVKAEDPAGNIGTASETVLRQ